MTRKFKRLFIAVIIIQIVFLLGLVGYRETILTLGRTAVLQTVPIDPRDLFKGEYVTLRYEISTLGENSNTPGPTYFLLGEINEGDTVYVGLEEESKEDGRSRFSVLHVQADEPSDDTDLFIKGRVVSSKGGIITVEYGIGQYFVPEGRGLEIEQADDVQVRIKINRSGTAAIKELIVDGEVWQP
ncbi:GDYXXLXY domain-containing protein [Dehalococcoides mccartyi]|nr:GDYXXLXY domain-containing protein [Dehalococcoides mccartyi]